VKKFVIIAFSTLSLAACAEYNVAGQFENGGQPFVGNVVVSWANSGTININSLDGRIQCTGTSHVTKQPSGYTGMGAQGYATALCNDGRTFKIDFIQSSDSGGHGQGIDSNGNIVQMYFDKSKSMALSKMDQQRLNALIK